MKNKLRFKRLSSLFLGCFIASFSLASHPCITRHRFRSEEDQKLSQLVQQYGDQKWKLIAEFMPNRTARQCRERYINYLAPNINKDDWTPAEDELLLRLVQQLGHKWTLIAQIFPGRTDVHLKNRYCAYLKNLTPQPQDNLLQQQPIPQPQPAPQPQFNLPNIDDSFDNFDFDHNFGFYYPSGQQPDNDSFGFDYSFFD
jgi:hypothetical protein